MLALNDKKLSKILKYTLIIASLLIIVGAAAAIGYGSLPVFVNNQSPALNATNLNQIVNSINDRGLNVKDYGVKGDGNTDDTAAILAIINSGAKNICFPPGTYKVSQNLAWPSGALVQGSGPSNTIIQTVGDITPFLLQDTRNTIIRDFGVITSSSQTLPVIDVVGVNIMSKYNLVENINVQIGAAYTYTGLRLYAKSNNVYWNHFNKLFFNYPATGIRYQIDANNQSINCNYFSDIWVNGYVKCLDMTGTGATGTGLGGNEFYDVWGQTTGYSTDGFIMDGANEYYGCAIVDWEEATNPNYQYHFLSTSSYNMFIIHHENMVCVTELNDEGTLNKIISPRTIGYTARKQGTTSIPSGSLYVDVPHGLPANSYGNQLLSNKSVIATPINNLGSATKYWLSNYTAATFRINVDQNPGASGADFVWMIL